MKCSSDDQIKKNEMGGACGMHGGEERFTQELGGGNMKNRDHLEDGGVGRMVILKWISKK